MPPKGLTGDALIDWYCMYVPSSVSLAACLYMFATYAMFKNIRTPAVNLVMLQTLAEVFLSISHNVAFYNPPATDTNLCRFQGWFINFAILSSLMFTAAISGYMNMTLRRTRRQIELNAKNLVMLAIGIFGFAGLCAALPLISDQYVDLGPRCWIAEGEEGRDRNAGVAYRFATHYVIIWITNIYLFVCYYEVIKYLRETSEQRAKRGDNKQIQRTIRILMYYPIICFCVWIPHTALRLTTAIRADPYLPPAALGFAHVLLSFQGTMYAIAFSQYRVVRREWKLFLFGSDAIMSTAPLTMGKQLSDQSHVGHNRKGAAMSTLWGTEKMMTTGFDVTTIDDMSPEVFAENHSDLELRDSSQLSIKFTTNV